MPENSDQVMNGGCACGAVRYRMTSKPMIVHCCHCRWCQRETGPSFALNAVIEACRVDLVCGEPEPVDTPSESDRGQEIMRCPSCSVAVWSRCAGAGEGICFVRVDTLNEPDCLPPDIQIYTRSKQPWLILQPGTKAVEEFYDRESVGPATA